MISEQASAQLQDLAESIGSLVEAEEIRLRNAHPRMTHYLELTILTRRLWGGGWEVLGELYSTPAEAEEARRAAIMHKLTALDRQTDHA